jgi:hypothetical protein
VNLLAARIVLRPRSFADVLDLALPFCLANRRLLGKLALVALAPIAATAAWLRLGRGWAWPAVWLVVAGLAFLAEGVFTSALGEALFRPAPALEARAVLGRFARRLLPYLAAQLLRGLILLVCGALVLPLAFEAPRELFVPEAVLLENAGVGRAFTRSRALSRDRGFFCLGILLAAALMPVVGAIVGELVGQFLVGFGLQLGKPAGELWHDGGSGFAVVAALAAVPVAAAARFLGYIDLRTRREGWDIQLRFVAMVERDAEGRRVA